MPRIPGPDPSPHGGVMGASVYAGGRRARRCLRTGDPPGIIAFRIRTLSTLFRRPLAPGPSALRAARGRRGLLLRRLSALCRTLDGAALAMAVRQPEQGHAEL